MYKLIILLKNFKTFQQKENYTCGPVCVQMILEYYKDTVPTEESLKKELKSKKQKGTEIANILYNNMIPVYDEVITPVTVNPEVDTYISNEIRFIRKTWEVIQNKALYVYDERYLTSSKNYSFLVNTCCDFKKLEAACQQYQVSTDN